MTIVCILYAIADTCEKMKEEMRKRELESLRDHKLVFDPSGVRLLSLSPSPSLPLSLSLHPSLSLSYTNTHTHTSGRLKGTSGCAIFQVKSSTDTASKTSSSDAPALSDSGEDCMYVRVCLYSVMYICVFDGPVAMLDRPVAMLDRPVAWMPLRCPTCAVRTGCTVSCTCV